MPTTYSTQGNSIAQAICLLWAGSIIGLSFIATPAKFLVVDLDLITAIKVGRETFRIFNWWEMVMCCALLLTNLLNHRNKRLAVYTAIVTLLLAIQLGIVKPILNGHTETLITDLIRTKAPSHTLYVVFEALKVFVLLSFFSSNHLVEFRKRC